VCSSLRSNTYGVSDLVRYHRLTFHLQVVLAKVVFKAYDSMTVKLSVLCSCDFGHNDNDRTDCMLFNLSPEQYPQFNIHGACRIIGFLCGSS
jgi:hypothetical protein